MAALALALYNIVRSIQHCNTSLLKGISKSMKSALREADRSKLNGELQVFPFHLLIVKPNSNVLDWQPVN